MPLQSEVTPFLFLQVVSTVDPFGYYAEGIQQRLDDAFVEGETSSQGGHADQGTPSAEETHSFAPPLTTAANAAGNGSTAPVPEEPSAPSTQEEAQVASTSLWCVRAAVKFQALHLHLTAVVESAPDSVPLTSDSPHSSLIQGLLGRCILPASYF